MKCTLERKHKTFLIISPSVLVLPNSQQLRSDSNAHLFVQQHQTHRRSISISPLVLMSHTRVIVFWHHRLTACLTHFHDWPKHIRNHSCLATWSPDCTIFSLYFEFLFRQHLSDQHSQNFSKSFGVLTCCILSIFILHHSLLLNSLSWDSMSKRCAIFKPKFDTHDICHICRPCNS